MFISGSEQIGIARALNIGLKGLYVLPLQWQFQMGNPHEDSLCVIRMAGPFVEIPQLDGNHVWVPRMRGLHGDFP